MISHGRPPASVFLAAALGAALGGDPASAACDTIPDPPQRFRGALGTVDTPFGRPDSPPASPVPDPRDVEVASHACNPKQLAGQDYVVTVVFKPPRGAGASIVALTAQADCSALRCDGGESFHCVSGTNAAIVVSSVGNKIRFRFPDTDALVPGDRRTLAGPALIAVSRASDPLPCKLARQRCQDPGRPAELFACVDEIFDEASCKTGRADLDPIVPHFTALPPMNDWQRHCKSKHPPCKDLGGDLLLAVDQAGDALLPVSWAGVLAPKGAKRVVEGGTRIPAATGLQPPIRIPSDRFLTSLPPRGKPAWPSPPTFKPHPTLRPGWFDLTGDTDKPESVLRISRRRLWEHECQGGAFAAEACEPGLPGHCGAGACVQRPTPSYFACGGVVDAGRPCTHHADCAGDACLAGSKCFAISTGAPGTTTCHTDLDCAADEECGRGLFELRDRLVNGVGPIVIPPADYEAKVK